MSPEQFVSILAALAVVLGAIARCIHELRAYHRAVNSRMDELLALTSDSAFEAGRLESESKGVELPAGKNTPFGQWSSRTRRGHN